MKKQAPVKPQITEEQLHYLGGIFDVTYGLRGNNPLPAIVVSNKIDDPWLTFLADTFGGAIKTVPTQKDKTFWGWYLPLQARLDLFKLLSPENDFSRYVKSMPVIYDHDGHIFKLEKAINSGHE